MISFQHNPNGKAGVQIVDICLSTRSHNGGLINLQELCDLLCQKRKGARESVSEDDCLRAISKLKVLITVSYVACFSGLSMSHTLLVI